MKQALESFRIRRDLQILQIAYTNGKKKKEKEQVQKICTKPQATQGLVSTITNLNLKDVWILWKLKKNTMAKFEVASLQR